MVSLLEAITAFYAAAGAPLTSVPGPWLDVAKDKATYPYCVMSDSGGSIDKTMDGRFIQRRQITFRIYHTDMAALGVLQNALHDRFDRTKPAIGDAICLSFERENDFRGFAGRGPNNTSVYVATSLYAVQVQDVF